MVTDLVLKEKDLVDNPSTRLPVCLCLDISGSMSGDPINELNDGVQFFFDAIKQDEIARYSVEISIVTFESQAKQELDFASVDRQSIPKLSTGGLTSMGQGVNLALDLLETRKSEYSKKGVDYYQPWLVLMTDGVPTDDIYGAIQRVINLSEKKKLTVFPVAIGEGSHIEELKKFKKNGQVLKVRSAEYFRNFFEWLSQSVAVASQSVPGQKVDLPDPSKFEIEM